MSEAIGSARKATLNWMTEAARLNLRCLLIECMLDATNKRPAGLCARLSASRCRVFRIMTEIQKEMGKTYKGNGALVRPAERKRTRIPE